MRCVTLKFCTNSISSKCTESSPFAPFNRRTITRFAVWANTASLTNGCPTVWTLQNWKIRFPNPASTIPLPPSQQSLGLFFVRQSVENYNNSSQISDGKSQQNKFRVGAASILDWRSFPPHSERNWEGAEVYGVYSIKQSLSKIFSLLFLLLIFSLISPSQMSISRYVDLLF